MALIKQYSRLSHHTLTTSGSAFTVPGNSIEDFTGGTWTINDLALSEIGVNEGDGTVAIRVGDNIEEFVMSGSGNYLPLTGGEMTGDIDMTTGTKIKSDNKVTLKSDYIELTPYTTDIGTITLGSDTTATGVVQFAEYTVATIPLASSYQGGYIMVTDETGGYTPAFSDGTDWRRTSDRAIVS